MKTLLQLMGLRTTCCNAKAVAWHSDKHYCASCERWLDKPQAVTAKVKVAARNSTTA